jgi:hypothetical protein
MMAARIIHPLSSKASGKENRRATANTSAKQENKTNETYVSKLAHYRSTQILNHLYNPLFTTSSTKNFFFSLLSLL